MTKLARVRKQEASEEARYLAGFAATSGRLIAALLGSIIAMLILIGLLVWLT